MIQRNLALTFASIACLTVGGLVGCDNDTEAENRMENAGERVENAAEKAGDNMERAADRTGDKLENAGDKMKDAAD